MHRGAKHEAVDNEGWALGNSLATAPVCVAAECKGTDARMICRIVQPRAEREGGWAD